MENKFFYYHKKDWTGFDHYYKLNEDFEGLHVNLTTPCINWFKSSSLLVENNLPLLKVVTEGVFENALSEVILKLGLTVKMKPHKLI
jgi:hypothetical protein